MCKKFYLTSLTLLLSLVSNIHALEITTIDGIGADTYLSNDGQGGNYGPDSVHGADNSIAIRNYEGVRQKFGYIRFDLTGIAGDLSGATLSITINISNRNRNWLIYGLIDESLDNWDEATTSYSNAPGILPAALGSFALDENKLQLLGILSVLENTPTRETPNIYTSNTTDLNLDSFLQSDTNKIVTFVIINENSDSNASYWVATKEGNPAAAPKLTLPNAAFSGAMNPKPANGTEDIVRDGIILSWTPGESAISHDVYFGEDPNLVSNADRTNPSGVLLIEGHESNSIALDRQNFAKTYYWRIDEVSGTPEPIYKGQLWSFTTESLAYSIPGELITATTDSNEPGQGPENTINGSGLDNGLHSNESATMWLTTTGQTAPVSIKYEFDKIYKLYEMLVWNYNGESILSMYGFSDVSVDYSIDNVNWIQIEGVSEFSQAPGTDGYASDITIEFGDVTAKYVRITAGSNWSNGLFDQYGLSEVRFMYIPTSARGPDQPANGATDVALDTIISWKSGREVVEHDIYLSKDRQSVIDGTAFVTTVSQSSYGPLSLELGSTYYWRIDEVNNTAVIPLWPGDIWSFTTQEYLVVDDFESYNEIAEGQEGSNLVYLTWIDGYANPSTNGSTTGYFEAFQPTMETNIVHSGNQSVPIFYNNITAGISEVTVSTNSLPIGPDWASVSPEFLSIWFYGDPNNAETDQMYVEIDGSRTTYDGDLIQDDWQQWSIDLTSPGINLANVGTLTIGFESTGATGTSGKVIFDDIQLYTPAYIEQ